MRKAVAHRFVQPARFEILVQDLETGAPIDALPPPPAAVDDQADTIAYGAQLWCAR